MLGTRARLLGLIVGLGVYGSIAHADDARRFEIKNREFLRHYAESRGFSLGLPSSFSIPRDNSAVLFLRSNPKSIVKDLFEFDPRTGEERTLVTAEQLLRGTEEQLSVEERARRERLRLSARGITSYELSDDGTKILFPLSGRLFVFERANKQVRELVSEFGSPIDPHFSPDGTQVACVHDGDLYVFDLTANEEKRLTTKAGLDLTNGVSEFVAQEEMDRFSGYWWSPDSKFIAYQQTDTSDVEKLHIADAFNPDHEPDSWPYPRPGKKNASVRLGVIPATGGETVWIDWSRERFPYLATVCWQKEAPLTLVTQSRDQAWLGMSIVDPRDGSKKNLQQEHDDAWVDIDQSMPKWFAGRKAYLWTSSRYGENQLRLRDLDKETYEHGKPFRPSERELTSKDFNYRGFISLREDGKEALFYGGDDPLSRQIFSIALDDPDSKPKLVPGDGTVRSAVYSRDHSLSVEWFGQKDGRFKYVVRRADGSVVGEIKSLSETPEIKLNVELTTVSENPAFHVALVRPNDFDPEKRYPVIDSAYGGPHANVVRVTTYSYMLDQWLADQGFIVVRIDGRGTPNRGHAWERAIKGNLIDKPLEDHVTALRALGEKYKELDLTRVGVYGWSFGGYFSAMAVMKRPDVFHAGVAGAPVCDWRDYDTHYTERYLGLLDQNPSAYDASSVLTFAPALSRPLLIIHGTTDDNVYFTHSLKMSDALFRAGKAHDFLPLSNFTHMVADPDVTEHLNARITEYFMRHLQH